MIAQLSLSPLWSLVLSCAPAGHLDSGAADPAAVSLAPGEPAAAALAPDDPWGQVQRRIASQGLAFAESAAGLTVELPLVGLRLQAEGEGLGVLGEQGERLRLRTRAWGRGGDVRPWSAGGPALGTCAEPLPGGPCVRRAERRGGELTEWWVGLPTGLEQGYTVHRAPEGEGLLVIEVALDGAEGLQTGGDGLALRDREGGSWSVGQVLARDAEGRILPATLSPLADGLRIEVDDRGAVGPIEIDPVYETASWTASGGVANFRLGQRLTFVGDVNGDGYDEIVVTYHYYRGSRSTLLGAYLYYGSASGPATSPVELVTDTLYYGDLTYRVARLGDVNGDGYGDFALSFATPISAIGVAYIYYGSSAGVGTSPDLTIEDSASGNNFGVSVAGVGDVNGDGYADLGVGAYAYDGSSGLRDPGGVFIYHGSASGLSRSPDTVLTGDVNYGYFGWALDGLGDVDGDGFDDIIVGAPLVSSHAGRASVFHGSAAGVESTAARVYSGSAASDYVGWSLAGIGDVNGDGYADAVVTAEGYRALNVYLGSADGLPDEPEYRIEDPDLASIGYEIRGLGDLNGDGYADLGYYRYDRSATRKESVVIRLGTPDGFSEDPDLVLEGDTSVTAFGESIGGGGDANGDGFDDLLIGAEDDDSYRGKVYFFEGYAAPTPMACTVPETGADARLLRYVDADRDGYGSTSTALACPRQLGYADNDQDCDDSDASVNPGAEEVCDGRGVDEDCNGRSDLEDSVLRYVDADGDGYGSSVAELACAGVSGYADNDADCDDGDAALNPAAAEVCDDAGVDEDCDGLVNDADPSLRSSTTRPYYQDLDGDGFGGAVAGAACTVPAGFVATSTDCDDGDAAVNPAAVEVCDDAGVDEDCNGLVDDADPSLDPTSTTLFYADGDGDGYAGGDGVPFCAPPAGYVATSTDCDDGNRLVNPGAQEVCDDHDFDEDCDGLADDDDPSIDPTTQYHAFRDGDGDGYGGPTPVSACEPWEGYVRTSSDCRDDDPAFHPDAVEDDCTDPNDYNCDGVTLYADEDGDGWAACTDCDDRDAGRNPDQAEVPGDGIDQDCDGADASAPDEGDGGDDEGDAAGGKSCASVGASGAGGAGLAVLGLLALIRRRRA